MITKRLRYEILRRDNFTCIYCGAKAPDVTLHVDHVLPVALGGSDKAENLATSCADCNAGKSATTPEMPTVEAVTEKHLQWRRALAQANEQMRQGNPEAQELIAEIREAFGGIVKLGAAAESKIEDYLNDGLGRDQIARAARIAFDNPNVDTEQVVAYMFGICRSMKAELHARAQAIIAAQEVAE